MSSAGRVTRGSLAIAEELASLSTRERLIFAQTVYEYGTKPGNWNDISNMLSKHAMISRPASFFTPQSCPMIYDYLMNEAELQSTEAEPRKAPIHEKLARKYYIARLQELKDEILAEENKFAKLVSEIDEIRSGQWDDRIHAQLPGVQLPPTNGVVDHANTATDAAVETAQIDEDTLAEPVGNPPQTLESIASRARESQAESKDESQEHEPGHDAEEAGGQVDAGKNEDVEAHEERELPTMLLGEDADMGEAEVSEEMTKADKLGEEIGEEGAEEVQIAVVLPEAEEAVVVTHEEAAEEDHGEAPMDISSPFLAPTTAQRASHKDEDVNPIPASGEHELLEEAAEEVEQRETLEETRVDRAEGEPKEVDEVVEDTEMTMGEEVVEDVEEVKEVKGLDDAEEATVEWEGLGREDEEEEQQEKIEEVDLADEVIAEAPLEETVVDEPKKATRTSSRLRSKARSPEHTRTSTPEHAVEVSRPVSREKKSSQKPTSPSSQSSRGLSEPKRDLKNAEEPDTANSPAPVEERLEKRQRSDTKDAEDEQVIRARDTANEQGDEVADLVSHENSPEARRGGKRKASDADGSALEHVRDRKRLREESEPPDEADSPAATISNSASGQRSIKDRKRFQAVIGMLHSQISAHRSGTIFHNPIKPSDAPDYYEIVKRPMDLKTIKARVRDGQISTSNEYTRDIYLMFANSMMYNRPNTDIYNMAEEMMLESEAHINTFRQTEGFARIRGG